MIRPGPESRLNGSRRACGVPSGGAQQSPAGSDAERANSEDDAGSSQIDRRAKVSLRGGPRQGAPRSAGVKVSRAFAAPAGALLPRGPPGSPRSRYTFRKSVAKAAKSQPPSSRGQSWRGPAPGAAKAEPCVPLGCKCGATGREAGFGNSTNTTASQKAIRNKKLMVLAVPSRPRAGATTQNFLPEIVPPTQRPPQTLLFSDDAAAGNLGQRRGCQSAECRLAARRQRALGRPVARGCLPLHHGRDIVHRGP
jgi:hypothetical protein